MAKKKTYKVWLVVEERIVDTKTGKEIFKDIEDDTRSVGEFNTYDEAVEQINEIGNLFEGNFT